MSQVPATPWSPYIISPFCLDIRALGMQTSFWTEKKGEKWGISLLCGSMNSLFSLLSSVSRKLRELDVADWRDLRDRPRIVLKDWYSFLKVLCFILFFQKKNFFCFLFFLLFVLFCSNQACFVFFQDCQRFIPKS